MWRYLGDAPISNLIGVISPTKAPLGIPSGRLSMRLVVVVWIALGESHSSMDWNQGTSFTPGQDITNVCICSHDSYFRYLDYRFNRIYSPEVGIISA